MTKFLTLVLSLTLLSACATSLDKNDIADEGGEDYYGPDVNPVQDEEPTEFVRDNSEGIETTVNEDGTYTFAYVFNGENLGQFNMEQPADGYNAYLLATFASDEPYKYVAVDPTGLGGYILYSGIYNIFQINTETHEVKELIFDGYATDFDTDLQIIVSVYDSESGPVIIVQNFDGENKKVYSVPAEFDQAGDANINGIGTKVIYQATITSDESEETAAFLIDLATDEQTEFARQEGLYDVVSWWSNDGVAPRVE